MRWHSLLLPLLLLTACTHVPDKYAETGPAKYRPWKRAPSVRAEDAVEKAMALIEGRDVDLSKGYVLEVSRGTGHNGEDCWWLWFDLLPLSPDYRVIVRVYDTGDAEFGP